MRLKGGVDHVQNFDTFTKFIRGNVLQFCNMTKEVGKLSFAGRVVNICNKWEVCICQNHVKLQNAYDSLWGHHEHSSHPVATLGQLHTGTYCMLHIGMHCMLHTGTYCMHVDTQYL